MAEPACIHAFPYAADQLHGICIFCYRDRLGAARSENALLSSQMALLRERVAVLERVKDEATLFLDGGGECSCGCWSAWCGVKPYNLIAALAAAKPAENGAGGA